jgi:hypothetical protein
MAVPVRQDADVPLGKDDVDRGVHRRGVRLHRASERLAVWQGEAQIVGRVQPRPANLGADPRRSPQEGGGSGGLLLRAAHDGRAPPLHQQLFGGDSLFETGAGAVGGSLGVASAPGDLGLGGTQARRLQARRGLGGRGGQATPSRVRVAAVRLEAREAKLQVSAARQALGQRQRAVPQALPAEVQHGGQGPARRRGLRERGFGARGGLLGSPRVPVQRQQQIVAQGAGWQPLGHGARRRGLAAPCERRREQRASLDVVGDGDARGLEQRSDPRRRQRGWPARIGDLLAHQRRQRDPARVRTQRLRGERSPERVAVEERRLEAGEAREQRVRPRGLRGRGERGGADRHTHRRRRSARADLEFYLALGSGGQAHLGAYRRERTEPVGERDTLAQVEDSDGGLAYQLQDQRRCARGGGDRRHVEPGPVLGERHSAVRGLHALHGETARALQAGVEHGAGRQ